MIEDTVNSIYPENKHAPEIFRLLLEIGLGTDTCVKLLDDNIGCFLNENLDKN